MKIILGDYETEIIQPHIFPIFYYSNAQNVFLHQH